MSLSKQTNCFPYYPYPYTYSEKLNYYSGRIFCIGATMVGAGAYARFILKQSYLNDKQIGQLEMQQLQKFVDTSNSKRKFHGKFLLTASILLVPGLVLGYRYKYIGYKQLIIASIGSGIVLLNNVYGILAHTYNSIRYNTKINKINHEDKIDKAAAVVAAEIPPWGQPSSTG